MLYQAAMRELKGAEESKYAQETRRKNKKGFSSRDIESTTKGDSGDECESLDSAQGESGIELTQLTRSIRNNIPSDTVLLPEDRNGDESVRTLDNKAHLLSVTPTVSVPVQDSNDGNSEAALTPASFPKARSVGAHMEIGRQTRAASMFQIYPYDDNQLQGILHEEAGRPSSFLQNISDEKATEEDAKERLRDLRRHLQHLRRIKAYSDSISISSRLGKYFPLRPNCIFRVIWDSIALLLTLYSAVLIPFTLAFAIESGANDPLYIIDRIIDTYFLSDIILSFVTISKHNGISIKSYRGIAENYVKGWFVVDLLASLPFDVIVDGQTSGGCSASMADSGLTYDPAASGDLDSLRLFRLLRMLRLIRLLRLLRLVKMLRLFALFEEVMPSPMMLKFGKLILIMFLIGHMNACMVYWAASANSFDENTWVAAFLSRWDLTKVVGFAELDDPYNITAALHSPAVLGKLYLCSLYFSFATLTTVGYGDITAGPHTEEQISAIVSMCVGTSLFAFIVGSLASLATKSEDLDADVERKRQILRNYLAKRNVPLDLRKKIRDYAEYKWNRVIDAEENIMEDLSIPLRIELSKFVNSDAIRKIVLFHDADINLTVDMLSIMKPFFASSGEILVNEGEVGKDMFIIHHGRTIVETLKGRKYVKTLVDGNFFGELALLFGCPRLATVKTAIFCDLFQVTQEDLSRLSRDYPILLSRVKATAAARLRELGKMGALSRVLAKRLLKNELHEISFGHIMLDESKNKNIDLLTTEAEKLGPDESMRRVTKLLYFREWILWKDICKRRRLLLLRSASKWQRSRKKEVFSCWRTAVEDIVYLRAFRDRWIKGILRRYFGTWTKAALGIDLQTGDSTDNFSSARALVSFVKPGAPCLKISSAEADEMMPGIKEGDLQLLENQILEGAEWEESKQTGKHLERNVSLLSVTINEEFARMHARFAEESKHRDRMETDILAITAAVLEQKEMSRKIMDALSRSFVQSSSTLPKSDRKEF